MYSIPPRPRREHLLDPETIEAGGAATVAWSVSNALSVAIEPDIGAVGPDGSVTVSPAATTTYTLTETGPGGVAMVVATVTVGQLAPVVAIGASPESIRSGESATLTWSATHADSVVIEPNVGVVAPVGSAIVAPVETTVYTITATGPGGTRTASVTIAVIPPPEASIGADPTSVGPGGASTMAWNSTNADSVFIQPDIGYVALSGSIVVMPALTTVYTRTAEGPGGSVSESVTLTVIPPPEASIGADPTSLSPGEASIITWSTMYAD